jgi:hypothetical protein
MVTLSGVYLVGTGSGGVVTSYAPCIVDITIGGPAANQSISYPLPYAAVSPNFAERLFNSNGYVNIASPAAPSSGTTDGIFVNGMYVAY